MSFILDEKDIKNIIENGFAPDDYVMQTCVLGWSVQDMLQSYNPNLAGEDNEKLVYDKSKLELLDEVLSNMDKDTTTTDFGDTYEALLGSFKLHAQRVFSIEELKNMVKVADSPKWFNNRGDISNKVFNVSKSINNGRTPQSVTLQLVSEVGELAEEIRIDTDDNFYKEKGPDGVLGESVDILIATLDLLYLYGYGNKQIHDTIDKKLSKWKYKATK